MKPEIRSRTLLGITRSQAKMLEFSVPEQHRLTTQRNPADLFPLTIAMVGDLAAAVNGDQDATELISAARQELRFAAYFFDAYLNGTPEAEAREHLMLIASAAYYLCDLPGSSMVLAQRWSGEKSDAATEGLDEALAWYLRGGNNGILIGGNHRHAPQLNAACQAFARFYREGDLPMQVLQPLQEVRDRVYLGGTARQLLLVDLIFAVAKRRIEISSRTLLPHYTDIAPAAWEPALSKATFMRELWPAQRLLGERGIFRGGSGVVQMPTSAGKTRATEIMIRGAFLSNRTKIVVVVAPFRALCHEIRAGLLIALRGDGIQVDEISDVPQNDFTLDEEEKKQRVLIVTPEKLLYLLRQEEDLAQQIGLLIYDEGHQFDAGFRGVTYELLLTSLKPVVPANCQVVLISAVISNAEAINEWLNGEKGLIVSGADLLPSLRSVAFASWVDSLGELRYTAQSDSGRHQFYVPRVLSSKLLGKLTKGERKPRYFPTRGDGQSIALFLGLKLVPQGSVAVFCGVKSSVKTACETLAEAYARGLDLPAPREESDAEEVARLATLVRRHLGDDGPLALCADLGVFTHHGSTPTGIRLAVEHAMKNSLIKMVVCTSTLAQGVNLPLRYLLITGVYQGKERMKVRDFQNLIGRAGRSGMHTEGSVIFADPQVFDSRDTGADWRWQQAQELLDPMNSEDCASHLLTIFNPIYNDQATDSEEFSVRKFVRDYFDAKGGFPAILVRWEKKLVGRGYSAGHLRTQLRGRAKIIDALESFLMAASSEELVSLDAKAATQLARGTLAHHLAEPEDQKELETLFQTIAKHVLEQVPEAKVRQAYSRSLFGVRDSVAIHKWVTKHTDDLDKLESDDELLAFLWPMLLRGINHPTFLKCSKPEVLPEFAVRWMNEESPATLLEFATKSGLKIGLGEKPRRPDFDHVVDLCENALAYEGVLVLTAVIESLDSNGLKEAPITERILHLQKRIKYGLKTATAIALHEMGFADRAIASDIATILVRDTSSRKRIRQLLRFRANEVEALLAQFPSYYSFVWTTVVRGRRLRT